MAADESGVFVAEGDVERHAGAAAFFRRGNQRGAFAERFADRRAELRMKNRGGMFEFAVFTDSCGLAVTFRGTAGNAKSCDGAFGQKSAKFLADFHEFG